MSPVDFYECHTRRGEGQSFFPSFIAIFLSMLAPPPPLPFLIIPSPFHQFPPLPSTSLLGWRAGTTTKIQSRLYTEKKEKIFLIYKEILTGAVAKSYMRKGYLIHEEMRKYFPIYEEAVSHIYLCNCFTLIFLIYEENLFFFFIRVSSSPSLRVWPH